MSSMAKPRMPCYGQRMGSIIGCVLPSTGQDRSSLAGCKLPSWGCELGSMASDRPLISGGTKFSLAGHGLGRCCHTGCMLCWRQLQGCARLLNSTAEALRRLLKKARCRTLCGRSLLLLLCSGNCPSYGLGMRSCSLGI